MLKIWGRLSSINVRKVVWAAQELGITVQRTDAGGQFGLVREADYLQRNPNGLVPLMEDDETSTVLWESNPIVRYLCARHSPGELYPETLRERFVAEQWMDWQQTTLNPAGRDAFIQWIRTPAAQRNSALIAASVAATDGDVRRAMDICVDNANRAIFGAASSNPTYAGMGTTLVLGVFRSGRLLMGHIGDSRAYRWRDGVLQQITKDHSLLQEQIDAGMLTPEQAQYAANKNLVTRALGVEDMVLLETHQHDVVPGDVYLMCSDGLSDMLRDAQIAEIMAAHPSLSDMGEALVAAANEAGGRDNIAVVLARAVGTNDPSVTKSWWPFKRLSGHA